MSDCGSQQKLNFPESERVTIAVETSVDEIKHAFAVLAEEGWVTMELTETFYSPCAGDVVDKFGILWRLVGRSDRP